MAARLQALIDRVPSGLRRIIIAVIVLVILAFLFPLTDDDHRRSPPISDLVPPTLFQATPAIESSPMIAVDTPVATAPDRSTPSSSQQDVLASPAAATSRPSATRVVATRTPTPVFICTLSPHTDWELYTVRRGDTLQAIAQLVGVSVADLAEANCLQDPNRITAGQSIWAPALPNPFATPTRTPRPTVTRTPTPSN
ncbi:MAG: LysM peptidoglycan-binding domain-containing protein [Anaerolineae bacterium]|nr:LysM peptidoglycan-binding domain-containing protein [Anaerolineae bacterium]